VLHQYINKLQYTYIEKWTGKDNKNLCSELLDFRTPSIVWYSNSREHISETGSLLSSGEGETPTLLGPLKRPNLNQWTTHVSITTAIQIPRRRPIVVWLHKHRHNLKEKSKLAQHAYKEGHRAGWDEARILEIKINRRSLTHSWS
jgi:hypothetical protein